MVATTKRLQRRLQTNWHYSDGDCRFIRRKHLGRQIPCVLCSRVSLFICLGRGAGRSQSFRSSNGHLDEGTLIAYSQRNAVMGSTDDALHDGIRHASPEANNNTTQVPINISALEALFSTQLEISRFNPTLKVTPATNPNPTLTPAELKTFRKTSPFCAPNARRMPNSFVRCATE
jgi:hypothetical protein